MALFAMISLTTVSCQKENLVEPSAPCCAAPKA